MKNQNQILNRLKEITEFFEPVEMEPFWQELFESYLKNTSVSGEQLAKNYLFVNEVKGVLVEISNSINQKKQKRK